MKKGDRRRHNKHKRKAIELSTRQVTKVHKIRKKLRKNPAFKNMDFMPGVVDAACDMAVLQLLRQFGVSSRSILEIILPVVDEVLKNNGVAASIPIGNGMSVGLRKPEDIN